MANKAAELIRIQALLTELGITVSTLPMLWCDNMSASSLAVNPTFHARTKHIEVDVHFVCNRMVTKKLVVRYVPSTYQMADILTKVLSTVRFLYLRDKLNVFLTPYSLRGAVR